MTNVKNLCKSDLKDFTSASASLTIVWKLFFPVGAVPPLFRAFSIEVLAF